MWVSGGPYTIKGCNILLVFQKYEKSKSGFELSNRLHTVMVGILLRLVLTLDVFSTLEIVTSQCKWHMHCPCTLKSLHHGFLTPGDVIKVMVIN